MQTLTATQQSTINYFSDMLYATFCFPVDFVEATQKDPETGSVLCKLTVPTEGVAFVWVRQNGSLAAVNGRNILLVGKRKPKKWATNDQIFGRAA